MATSSHTTIAGRWLRALCVLSTLASSAVNVALLVAHRPIFAALGVPLPVDVRLFFVETSLSFTIGLVGLLAVRQGKRVESLLAVGVLGKGLYATTTFAFCALGHEHGFFYSLAAGDAFLVFVFLLYWIQSNGEALFELEIDVFEGIANSGRAATKKALLVSISEKRTPALDAIETRLRRHGYEVDAAAVVAQGAAASGSVMGALLRWHVPVAPLRVPRDHDHDWDLVVVESPDWLFGVAAPVEAALRDPANRWIFQGRDAAVLVVSRGSHRRALAMIVALLERAGANVVAARAVVDDAAAGLFPAPLGAATYTLTDAGRTEAESLGASLAARARTRPHWTLLLGADEEPHA